MTKEEAVDSLCRLKSDIKNGIAEIHRHPSTVDDMIIALDTAIKALEERKKETCTNVGTDYAEVDQFVCSECGIELQDWHRVERDVDDGEVSYHEYTFHFCPNCGCRIVGGALDE